MDTLRPAWLSDPLDSVLDPDDEDLPILSSLLDSLRPANTAPAIEPLESLQSLPVVTGML